MKNLQIGHHSNHDHGTGVTVFLFDEPVQGAYHLPGAAPASHELHVLGFEHSVTHVDALVFVGGSAFGLGCVDGVMRWLREQNRGFPTPYAPVPIVPAAGIFDLGVKQSIPPTADEAYQACQSASETNTDSGSIGAGTGASVGKIIPGAKAMSAGIGRAEIILENGLAVMAYAVVNAAGDVRDNQHRIIAGARSTDGQFADTEQYILSGQGELDPFKSNTTLVAVFTNAAFSRAELKRIAKMAISGMSRAISPVFTRFDGDLMFCFSLGKHSANELTVGTIAVEAVRLAIINAVQGSVVL